MKHKNSPTTTPIHFSFAMTPLSLGVPSRFVFGVHRFVFAFGELGNFPSWVFENWEIVMKKWEIPSKKTEYSVGKCSNTV